MSSATSIRQIIGPISKAERCNPRDLPKPRNIHSRRGIAYERNVMKALAATCKISGAELEIQPWFEFTDGASPGQAVPDALIFTRDGRILIVEVKLTFVIDAVIKMQGLYVPIVRHAYGQHPHSIVVCKNLTSKCLSTAWRLSDALELRASVPTLQWLGHGRIEW